MDNYFAILLALLIISVVWSMTKSPFMIGGAVDIPWYLGNVAYDPALIPGTTRNMSYDIRGDPYIPFRQVSPWNNPEVLPIRWNTPYQ